MQNDIPRLIVMLTKNDMTVPGAYGFFEAGRGANVQFWGIKDKPLEKAEMKRLISYMKSCGKTACVEVVEYTQKECLEGARTAIDCGCDILLGTMFYDSVNNLCRKNSVKYMPFVGRVEERPSVLYGTAAGMAAEANEALSKGAFGIDLLGYRHTKNGSELIKEVVKSVPAPVCVAGSVDSFEKLDEIKAVSPWAFTVGTALFDGNFGSDFASSINAVASYIGR